MLTLSSQSLLANETKQNAQCPPQAQNQPAQIIKQASTIETAVANIPDKSGYYDLSDFRKRIEQSVVGLLYDNWQAEIINPTDQDVKDPRELSMDGPNYISIRKLTPESKQALSAEIAKFNEAAQAFMKLPKPEEMKRGIAELPAAEKVTALEHAVYDASKQLIKKIEQVMASIKQKVAK